MLRPLLAALAIALATPALAADPEANKKIVVAFYDKALNQKDFDAAAKGLATSSTILRRLTGSKASRVWSRFSKRSFPTPTARSSG
jgi:hypothetical protein